MNWKTASMALIATATLTACGNNGNETGQGLNDGVQQTRFNSTTDYPSEYYQNTRYGTRDNLNGGNGYDGMFNYRGNNTDDNPYNRNRNIGNDRDNGFADRNNQNTQLNNPTNDQNNNTRLNNRNDQGQNNQYDVSERAAEEISDKVDNVDRAYVLTTDNNAYVAAELNKGTENGDDISDELEREITRVVKDVDNDIDNVYVSTNPDFVNLTNNYVNDVNNGEPIEGFFEQFGEMVERIFPRAR